MESTGKRKAPKSKLLAFPAKKNSKFPGKRYFNEVKDITFKVADWVKFAIEKQTLGERLILSETVIEQTCAICKISESTFYRTSKGKKEIQKNKDEEQKVDGNKVLLNDFDKTVISRIILSFYRRPKPEFPTIWQDSSGRVRHTRNKKNEQGKHLLCYE